MNALRLQFKAERKQIQKDANRTIGRLNTAIGQVGTQEAREALRAEKARVYEATRASHRYNRLCYHQQLEMLEDEYSIHLSENPSKKKLRRMMTLFYQTADARGQKSITLHLGDGRVGTVSFS